MLPGNDVGTWSNDYRYSRLDVRVSRFPDSSDTTTFYANIRFDNTPVIHNHRVRDHGVDRVTGRALRLAHPIPDNFAASEFDLFSINGAIAFNLDEELGIRQPDTIPRGWAEHFCVSVAGDFHGAITFP
jgi:hypothetical protein